MSELDNALEALVMAAYESGKADASGDENRSAIALDSLLLAKFKVSLEIERELFKERMSGTRQAFNLQ